MIKGNNSDYRKDDFRSKDYSGDWVKHWLRLVSESALIEKKSIFEKMWEKCNEKAEHMPKTIFKFYSFNQNSLKCIESNKVYLNSPENFNDPYDCFICSNENDFVKTFFIEYIKRNGYVQSGVITESEFEKIKDSYPDDEFIAGHYLKTFDSVLRSILFEDQDRADKLYEICYQARQQYKKTISVIRNKKIRVSSFSCFNNEEFCRSTEMWGYYAASHTGFCVEYDLENALPNIKMDSLVRGGMMPCKYSKKPVFIHNSLFWKYFDDNKLTENQKIQFDKTVLLSFLNKSSSWRNEKEWRLIVPDEISNIYDNLINFFPIKTIYLGVKMSKSDKEYFYDFAKRKNISVVDMQCRTDGYELEFRTIDIDEYTKWHNFHLQCTINKSDYAFLWNM